MQRFLLIAVLLLFLSSANGQSLNRAFVPKDFDVTWAKMLPMRDGGWLLAESKGQISGLQTNTLWLTRLNASGETINVQQLNTNNGSAFVSAFKPVPDGRFLLVWYDIRCGFLTNSASVALLDAEGQEVWQRSYLGSDFGLDNADFGGDIYDIAALPNINTFFLFIRALQFFRIKLDLSTGTPIGYIPSFDSPYTAYYKVANHPTKSNQLIWLSGDALGFYRNDTLDHVLGLPVGASGSYVDMFVAPGNPNILVTFSNGGVYRLDANEKFQQISNDIPLLGAINANKMAVYSRENNAVGTVSVYGNEGTSPIETYIVATDSVNNTPKQQLLFIQDTPHLLFLKEQGFFTKDYDYQYADYTRFDLYSNSNKHTQIASLENGILSINNTHDVGIVEVNLANSPTFAVPRDTFGNIDLRLERVLVTIKNYSDVPLKSVQINFFRGFPSRVCTPGLVYHERIGGLNVAGGETAVIELRPSLPLSLFSYQDFCLWTSLPNDQGDNNIENDVYCLSDFYKLLPLPNKFRVFPNPVRDKLFVSFEIGGLFGARFSIWSPTGQVLLDGVVRSENDYYVFDVESLPSGVYFLRAADKMLRFVKI